MKRLAILLIAVGWLGWAGVASAQTCSNTVVGNHVTCVSNATSFTAASSGTVTYASGYSSGTEIIVLAEVGGVTPASNSISDTDSFTWNFWGTCSLPTASQTIGLYYTNVSSTNLASDTITVSVASATFVTIVSALYTASPVALPGSTDGAGVCGNASSGSSQTTGAFSVSKNDLIIGVTATQGSTAAGTGWVNREQDGGHGANPPYVLLEDQIASSASTTATGTSGVGGPWSIIGLGFVVPCENACGAATLTGNISAPLFPQATPNATYPSESGYTITPVASAANLQTAINGAACGTILSLAHNGTWTTASAYTLPNTACTCHVGSTYDMTKLVILRSDAFVGGAIAGTRIDPSSEYTNLAHISSSDGNYAFTANTNGVSCYGFLGLDVTSSTDGENSLFSFGDGSVTQPNYSHDFWLWHNYIHGQPTKGLKRCVTFNGNWDVAVDNYISDCHLIGQDSQALSGYDGQGPWLVQNNFLEGAAENVIYGGANSQPGINACDLTFIKNHFFKPLAWRQADLTFSGFHWNIKNNFELKGGCRVLVTGNIFENDWTDGQTGQAISIKTSTNKWTNPSDINFYYNWLRHAGGALVFDADTPPPAGYLQPVHRVNFHDNLYSDIDGLKWGTTFSGSRPDVQIGGRPITGVFSPYDIWMNHETFSSNAAQQSTGTSFGNTPSVDFHYGIQITNSILDRASNGAFFGNGDGSGDGLISTYAPNLLATNDCIYGPSQGETYNNSAFNGKQLVTSGVSGVFVTPGSDFHVAMSSACHAAASDGLDMGANINVMLAATASTVQTLANLHTLTSISPTTFSSAGGSTLTVNGTNFINGEIQIIVGGAGPSSAISSISCTVNTCTVIMSAPITLAVTDTVNIENTSDNGNEWGQWAVASVTDTTHFTFTSSGVGTVTSTGGTANRYSSGVLCPITSFVSSSQVQCTIPAGTVGQVGVYGSQFGIPVQSIVFGTYN